MPARFWNLAQGLLLEHGSSHTAASTTARRLLGTHCLSFLGSGLIGLHDHSQVVALTKSGKPWIVKMTGAASCALRNLTKRGVQQQMLWTTSCPGTTKLDGSDMVEVAATVPGKKHDIRSLKRATAGPKIALLSCSSSQHTPFTARLTR